MPHLTIPHTDDPAQRQSSDDEGTEAEQDARASASENDEDSGLESDEISRGGAKNSAEANRRVSALLETEEEVEEDGGDDFREKFGSFHWVLGVHVASPAQLAAYFAQLAGAMEPPSALQSLWWFANPNRPNRVDAGGRAVRTFFLGAPSPAYMVILYIGT